MKFCVWLIALVFIASPAFAQENQIQDPPAEKPQERRILPIESGFRALEGTTFGLGVYKEITQYRLSKNYVSKGVGLQASFDQHIRGAWLGGLVWRWSEWEAIKKNASGETETISPMTIFSRIHYSPNLSQWIGDISGGILHPFAVAGVGYLTFFSQRALQPSRSTVESSEVAVTYGGGLRLVWPQTGALRFSFEKWRGVRTFKYTLMSYHLEVQFGDVDKP